MFTKKTDSESQPNSVEQTSDINLYMNSDKTDFMHFLQDGHISSLNSTSMVYVNKWFQHLQKQIMDHVDRIKPKLKSDTSSNKTEIIPKWSLSVLLYSWTLLNWLEKNLFENHTGIQRAVLNKSGKQHFTKLHLHDYSTSITQNIQVRRKKKNLYSLALCRHCVSSTRRTNRNEWQERFNGIRPVSKPLWNEDDYDDNYYEPLHVVTYRKKKTS